MSKKHWMVCDPFSDRNATPCLFDEDTALRRGEPRCIRHGALLFSDKTLDGLTREQARKKLNEESS